MESKVLKLASGLVRYWKGGEGPPLLLVHGAWGDAIAHWGRAWPALAEHHTVLAPDLPGWGASERQPRASTTRLAQSLAAVLAAEDLGPACVVGNSFGAALAWQLAGDRPAAVDRLVLVNGGPAPVLPGWLRRIAANGLARAVLLAGLRRASFSRGAIEKALVEPQAFPQDFVDRALEQSAAAAEIGLDAFRFQYGRPAAPAASVSLLWGDRDTLATWSSAERLAARLKARLVAVPGAGHLPQVHKPDVFVRRLLELSGSGAAA